MTDFISEQTCKAYRDGILSEIKSQVEKLEILAGKAQDDFQKTLSRIGEQVEVVLLRKSYDKEEIVDIFALELSKMRFNQLSNSIVEELYSIVNKSIDEYDRKIKNGNLNPESLKNVLPDALSLSDLSLVKIFSTKQISVFVLAIISAVISITGSWYFIVNSNDKMIDQINRMNKRINIIEEINTKHDGEYQYIKDTLNLLVRQTRATYQDYCKRNNIDPCE